MKTIKSLMVVSREHRLREEILKLKEELRVLKEWHDYHKGRADMAQGVLMAAESIRFRAKGEIEKS